MFSEDDKFIKGFAEIPTILRCSCVDYDYLVHDLEVSHKNNS